VDRQAAFCPIPACLARARAAEATFRFIANVSSATSVASVASPSAAGAFCVVDGGDLSVAPRSLRAGDSLGSRRSSAKYRAKRSAPGLVAGRLHIGSIPGNGAEVLLDVPMNEEALHRAS
jgi:hypothetical protein